MKFLLIGILVLCTTSGFSQQPESSQIGRKEAADSTFIQIADRWLKAYNGDDPTALTPLYAPNAQYISSHVQGLVAFGREAVIANFGRGMKMGGHLDTLEVLSVNRSCELATVLCRYHANNAGKKVSGRTLLVLKKIDAVWLIVLHMTVV